MVCIFIFFSTATVDMDRIQSSRILLIMADTAMEGLAIQIQSIATPLIQDILADEEKTMEPDSEEGDTLMIHRS